MLLIRVETAKARQQKAIDYPFESTEAAVEFIQTAPLAPADQARVAHVNAERILRLNH
jgi:2,3-dihydroxybenzoate decarboxylase